VAAWLTYDYANREVWLDDAGTGAWRDHAADERGDGGGHRWALCAGHAERLRVPLGWIFQDRRPGTEPLPASSGRDGAGQDPAPVGVTDGRTAGALRTAEGPEPGLMPLLPAAAG
jgi:hypothetical protein